MEASVVEAPIKPEIQPPKQLFNEVYGSGNLATRISGAEFGEANDSKYRVVYLMGWPWEASAKSTWDFPGQLAKGLNTICFSLSSKTERDDPQGLALQGEAMHQFLLKHGISKDTSVIIVAHAAAAKRGGYLTKVLEDNDIEVGALVLASVMGVSSRNPFGLVKDFITDVLKVGPKERQKAGVRARDKGPVIEKITPQEVTKEFIGTLLKDRRTKWLGLPLLYSQIKSFSSKDPIFSQIKAPVVDLTGVKDKVSDTDSYLSEAEVRSKMALLTNGEETNGEKISGERWEELRRKAKEKGEEEEFDKQYGIKAQFIIHDRDIRAKADERVRLAKARAVIAEQLFPKSKLVKVVRPTRQDDLNGIVTVRGEQVPSLIKRVITLAERATKKAT